MITIRDLYTFLDRKCPRSLACAWDNDGMMCAADADRPVKKILCVLDVTERTIEEAVEEGCDCMVSHHPLIFNPLSAVSAGADGNITAERVIRLLQSDISVMSFHTRLDAAEGGVNDTLCRKLGLAPLGTFGTNGETLGRIAEYAAPLPFASFCAQIKAVLGTPVLHAVSARKPVRKLAVLGGSGKDDWEAALAAGADTYLTGTMSYNTFLDAKTSGLNVVAAGHFYTERPVTETLAAWITAEFPDTEVVVSSAPCEVLSI